MCDTDLRRIRQIKTYQNRQSSWSTNMGAKIWYFILDQMIIL